MEKLIQKTSILDEIVEKPKRDEEKYPTLAPIPKKKGITFNS